VTDLERNERGRDRPPPGHDRDLREIMTEREIREKEQRDRLLDRGLAKPVEEGGADPDSKLLQP
jgi:hypothetical protein